MKRTILLFILCVSACTSPSGIGTLSPHADRTLPPIPINTIASETSTPADNNNPCAFTFADQSLPLLTSQIDKAIKLIQPEASASAQALGENCIYSDGHSTFEAMETDFKVNLVVIDLQNENELGTWIINVMRVLQAFPPGIVPGSQTGRVEIDFKSQSNLVKTAIVPINKYQSLPVDTSALQIYLTFTSNP